MNDKTAKLIRKYAGRTDEDKKVLMRRWEQMTQKERAQFRRRMQKVVEGEGEGEQGDD